jgi:hypothetical protein
LPNRIGLSLYVETVHRHLDYQVQSWITSHFLWPWRLRLGGIL